MVFNGAVIVIFFYEMEVRVIMYGCDFVDLVFVKGLELFLLKV